MEPDEHQDSRLIGEGRKPQGRIARWWQSEFQENNICLDYDRPTDFVTSQWQVRPKIYVLYRLIVAFVLIGWCAGDIAYETGKFYGGEAYRWLVFASNWSFLLLALTALMEAVTSTIYEFKPYWIIDPIYIRTNPWVLKFQWIMYNISSNSAFVVTTGYWGFIAFVSDAPLLTSHMSRLKHTMNSVYVLCNVMLGATPIRIYHMFFTAFAGSLYIVFNGLYFLENGSLVIRTGKSLDGRAYYFMNWAQPVEAICTCVLGIMMCIAFQIVLHGLYHFRLWLHRKLYPGNIGVDAEMQNIIGPSASYNSLDEAYGGTGP